MEKPGRRRVPPAFRNFFRMILQMIDSRSDALNHAAAGGPRAFFSLALFAGIEYAFHFRLPLLK